MTNNNYNQRILEPAGLVPDAYLLAEVYDNGEEMLEFQNLT